MPRAWTYQDDKQVKKLGKAKASWYVGWYDPAGRRRCASCGPGPDGKRNADKLRRKREGELVTGTYQDNTRRGWDDFKAEYTTQVMAEMDSGTRLAVRIALDHFERLINPKALRGVTTKTFADYVAKRRKEQGLKRDSLVSPATVNKELRTMRAVVRKAHKWGYLAKLPEFDFLKEPHKLPTYMTPEHFAKLYAACDQARLPNDLPCSAADWWRGLIVTGYMTGWRIGSLLALRRADVDFDAGTALSRAADNKGRRDQLVPLHPLAVDHLRRLVGFDPCVFPWNRNRRLLFEEFNRLQEAAGVKPTGGKANYGFHDLRRAFATMNADKLTPDALQLLMQHKDYQTTQRYINLARQVNPAVQNLFVPELPVAKTDR
jgi:integrase